MQLEQWAIKWGIPYEALADLRAQMIIDTDPANPAPGAPKSETAVQNAVRLEASQKGGRLWRNNVGQYIDDRGVPVRYGLCNESKQLNEKCKSSDLIGITPVKITPQMVGLIIGQFTAREIKPEDWTYSGTKREKAQLTYLNLVAALGGNAAFACRTGTL